METFRFSKPALESMPGIWQQALLCRKFTKPRFDFIWHLHPEFELTYIRRGYGVRYIGGSIKPFYEGDLCLLGGNLPHAYGSHPKYRGDCRWNVFHFLPEVWGDAFWKLPENKNILKLLEASHHGIHFHGKGVSAVVDKISILQDVPAGSGQCVVLFLEILHLLDQVQYKSILDPKFEDSKAGVDPRIGKVLHWLENHAKEEIHQDTVGQLIGMSPASFSRFFRQKTGRLFNHYVNEIRIAHAVISLVNTEKSVAEIAYESGFNNLANFNRRFAEIVKMTPREYRQVKRKE